MYVFNYFESVPNKSCAGARIVGQEPDFADAQFTQNLGADAKIFFSHAGMQFKLFRLAVVGELFVNFEPGKQVGFIALAQVHERAFAGICNCFEGELYLGAVIGEQVAQDTAGF